MEEKVKYIEWNDDIEAMLKEKQFHCLKYRWLHTRDSERYNNFYNYIFTATSIITSISATSSILSSDFLSSISKNLKNVLSLTFGMLLIFSTGLSSFQHSTNYSDLSARHKSAATKYLSLSNNMLKLLALDKATKKTSLDLFTWAETEYINLEINSPTPSKSSRFSYEKENGDIEKNMILDEISKVHNVRKDQDYQEFEQDGIDTINESKRVINSFNQKRWLNNQL